MVREEVHLIPPSSRILSHNSHNAIDYQPTYRDEKKDDDCDHSMLNELSPCHLSHPTSTPHIHSHPIDHQPCTRVARTHRRKTIPGPVDCCFPYSIVV